jgi:hypothetical protein
LNNRFRYIGNIDDNGESYGIGYADVTEKRNAPIKEAKESL